MIATLLAYGVWVAIVLIVVGFVALVKGADWLVDGASAIAKRFGISDLVIGLTVVAFGTSMPEFVVNMVSVASQTTDLAITNILGSNIINTFVILGCTALVYPIVSQRDSRRFDIPLSIVAGLAVLLAIYVPVLQGGYGLSINRVGGVLLLLVFCYFIYHTFRHAHEHAGDAETSQVKNMPVSRAVALIIGGLVGLIVGGELIVQSAVELATRMGVSEAIIGLTIVALGTSLPELATSVIAATKKNSDIALGNVIGSNIFNIFFVLGTSAVVRTLPAYEGIKLDIVMTVLGSVLVWIFVGSNRQHAILRWQGALLLLIYALYLTYRLMVV